MKIEYLPRALNALEAAPAASDFSPEICGTLRFAKKYDEAFRPLAGAHQS
jgi:hypothetical protein